MDDIKVTILGYTVDRVWIWPYRGAGRIAFYDKDDNIHFLVDGTHDANYYNGVNIDKLKTGWMIL